MNIQGFVEYGKMKKVVHVLADTKTPYHVHHIETNECICVYAVYEEAEAYRTSWSGVSMNPNDFTISDKAEHRCEGARTNG